MGKKRVVQKGGGADEQARTKPGRSADSKIPKIENGRVYISASYNNTLVALTDEQGNLIAQSSAGALGFNGPKKATPYAATKVIESLSDQMRRMGLKRVSVYVKGIGSGRESALRALPAQGLELLSIHDTTPNPHNGPRPRKRRRV